MDERRIERRTFRMFIQMQSEHSTTELHAQLLFMFILFVYKLVYFYYHQFLHLNFSSNSKPWNSFRAAIMATEKLHTDFKPK